MAKIKNGKPLHCVETITGDNLTGTLHLSDDEIRVDLYSFAEFFHIEAEQPIYLLAQTGQVVSFHSNVDSGLGTTHHHERTIYHQGFIANVAIAGHDRWTETDKVKKVTFAVMHTMELLRHQEKVKALGSSRLPKDEHFRIFEDAAKGMTLKAWYGAVYGMEFDAPKELWPAFEIEFDEPCSIHDYIQHVSNYVDFLSFCLGVKLKPYNIRIDRLSHAEMIEAVEAHTYRGDHEVHYVWPETEIDSRDLWVGGSPVRAWDEEELGALRACLVVWMNRADAWKKPYAMMMTSFALKNVISAERLINACRWFEDIPITSARNALAVEDIDAIAAAATKAAAERGHAAAIRERITGAIKWIKAESAEERFTRLVTMVEEKFGKGILPENAVTHLRRAIHFRGRTAHGHFNPESDQEFRAFNKSIRAMEALCYLLSALELPMSKEGVKRARSNPLVRDYHEAYE